MSKTCIFLKKDTFFLYFLTKTLVFSQYFCNFAGQMEMSIRIHNQLMSLSRPRVMAIVNLSPDSFYTSCDIANEQHFLSQVENALNEGADILDLGACSTRPHSQPIDAITEWQLLCKGLSIVRHHWPNVPLSVDTFRFDIAQQAISYGADMINDVSGALADPRMWNLAAQHHIPYVLTHAQTIGAEQPTMVQVLDFLQNQLHQLHVQGVADVIIDPGFGFGKTIEQNYDILRQLDVLQTLQAAILVGVSRKSMLYKPLGKTPQEVLPATVAAHMLALQGGAHILRVHDVQAAQQAIQIFQLTKR